MLSPDIITKYIQEDNTPLGLPGASMIGHIQSMTCIDLWTAVVFSLTKSDFLMPNCRQEYIFIGKFSSFLSISRLLSHD